jgi:hypothetical protein
MYFQSELAEHNENLQNSSSNKKANDDMGSDQFFTFHKPNASVIVPLHSQ